VEYLIEQAAAEKPTGAFIGLEKGKVRFTALDELPDLIEPDAQRPREQEWMALRPLAQAMARPGQSDPSSSQPE
jgi:6-phosphofructokinase 1